MKRKKKSLQETRRTRQTRRPLTYGEYKEALDAERNHPEKLARSPRLRRNLVEAKKRQKKGQSSSLRELLVNIGESWAKQEREMMDSFPPKLRQAIEEGRTPKMIDELPADDAADRVRELMAVLRGRRGAPVKKSTQERIQLAARLKSEGVSINQQGKSLFPGLTNSAARSRAFHSRYRQAIAQAAPATQSA